MRVLEILNLQKKYDERQVLNNLSFYVKEKEILGFLGPNAAGKSTSINIISTVLSPDRGNILFMGEDIKKNKKKYKKSIGVVPQKLAIFENVSAFHNVKFFAGFYDLSPKEINERVYEALDMVGLKDRAGNLPRTFSGGMKRRLNIACSLVHKPKLLILDEPTVGIDPQSRNHILNVIKKLRDQGTTVIYTTHYMEEVEAICDRVVIIDEGKIIKEGSIKELISYDTEIYTVSVKDINKLKVDDLKYIEGIKEVVLNDREIKITALKELNVINKFLQILINENIEILGISKEEESLENIFLSLTGKKLRD
ncbi:MAG: ABC transporter ATP-binding protein [Clostridium sp.]|nr:ABC transporter ATP-binding protein [Clostridium sp.]